MAQELIRHNVLSLDFWQDTVTYAGSVMPTGTIGCAVLNIPDETIARLDAPCMILNQLLTGIGLKNVDMQLLPKAQEAGQTIIHALHNVPPFSRLDRKRFEEFLMQAFSEEAFTELNEYLQLPMEQQAVSNITGAHPLAALLVRVIPVLGHLSYSLRQYKKTMTAFAEFLQRCSMSLRSVPAMRRRSLSSGCTLYPSSGCSAPIFLKAYASDTRRGNAPSAGNGF